MICVREALRLKVDIIRDFPRVYCKVELKELSRIYYFSISIFFFMFEIVSLVYGICEKFTYAG